MPEQPLDDLLARLERERQNADRAYNDALTALDRAIPSAPALPAPLTSRPGSPPPFGADPVEDERLSPAKAAIGGMRALFWRILGPPPGIEQRWRTVLMQYANRSSVDHRELHHTVAGLLETVRTEFQALARFESLLVQYLQTITLYVDTKDRSLGGSELRNRLALLEQRLMGIKREIETRSTESAAAALPSREVFAGPVDSSTYVGFEDRFRGAREEIRRRVEDYVPLLAGSADIVDIGCGRGELLDRLRAQGISARGVDANHAMVELCQARGLQAERADALAFLTAQADASIGGLVAIQVVEHFEPGYLARFLEAAYHKMKPGAPLILETINPVCWMAFFETYIRDLTHQRPLHPDTLSYLVESSGFSQIDVQYRSPVTDGDRLDRVALPTAVAQNPDPQVTAVAAAINAHADKLNARLFSSMDYVVIARR